MEFVTSFDGRGTRSSTPEVAVQPATQNEPRTRRTMPDDRMRTCTQNKTDRWRTPPDQTQASIMNEKLPTKFESDLSAEAQSPRPRAGNGSAASRTGKQKRSI